MTLPGSPPRSPPTSERNHPSDLPADDGGVLQEGKQGKDIDRTPFDAMMEVLSVPAMQARYFVARLVDRKSALHVAAAKGQTALVKVLLDKGANINDPDTD